MDDTGTRVLESSLRLRWVDPVPQPGSTQLMSGDVTVDVRLDVRRWKGQQVRIYKRLASRGNTRVAVRWQSQGRLMPGQLLQGERTLVFAGLVTSDEIRDVLRLAVVADGSQLEGRQVLDFDFELEVGSP
ncbi:hypothetical protein [Arenimonas sp.]|uniref:hypothetical protein n=1 Tax=Arenimonas sp. TaxID=1872635 RepID=UPI0035B39E5B